MTAETIARYERAGFGRPIGFGRRPAIVVVDVQYRSVGDTPKPIDAAMDDYPTACGSEGWTAIGRISELIGAARRYGTPVIHSSIEPALRLSNLLVAAKAPGAVTPRGRGYEIVEAVAPLRGEVHIAKRGPSAFFGTSLISQLVDFGVDSVIVTGCTTSGCVRATVVDAFSYGYRVIVPEDCVFDRSRINHAVSLFDMNYKYADVMPMRSVVRLLEQLKED